MNRIQITIAAASALFVTGFAGTAAASDFSDTSASVSTVVSEMAAEVSNSLADEIKASSERQLEQAWLALQAMLDDSEGDKE
ncbi:hypothetical protein [Echinimonas agarilytica]|uniref:Uncharacterized protein n=1 Tax=Echinimonas agarilytica TaxID=1215918 RepID=A0AA41W4N7_9GAMM|nr:hypothetical protein [Echinimonas agarilytica]MCM2678721.1 hypothetical protein [Echinimonas agarilytica]